MFVCSSVTNTYICMYICRQLPREYVCVCVCVCVYVYVHGRGGQKRKCSHSWSLVYTNTHTHTGGEGNQGNNRFHDPIHVRYAIVSRYILPCERVSFGGRVGIFWRTTGLFEWTSRSMWHLISIVRAMHGRGPLLCGEGVLVGLFGRISTPLLG